MIQAELAPAISPFTTTTARTNTLLAANNTSSASSMADNGFHSHSDDDEHEHEGGGGGSGKPRNKSRRELPTGAVATLKTWLLSPEHFTHPYPTPQDQVMLMQKTGIDKKQLKNWFTNARRRIWKPMLKKQLEQGKLATTGTGGGGAAMPGGGVPGLMVTNNMGQPHPAQAQAHNMQEIQVDQHGNQMMYKNQATLPHPAASVPAPVQYYDPNSSSSLSYASSKNNIAASAGGGNSQHILSKTDSHAVLMELFARDQDLVRQATETSPRRSAGQDTLQQQSQPQSLGSLGSQLHLGVAQQQLSQYASQPVSSQHPMKSHGRLGSVPTLNSWPHFSSVSSLNNLGTMPGVKSITSLSAADLAKQGPVNTVGNLAQVKSVESMGKNDSYAFLEVFFGDRSSNNLNSMGGTGATSFQRGVKRERDEDNDVGLSLEDESPSTGHGIKQENGGGSTGLGSSSDYASGNPYAHTDKISSDSSDTLKRAYDDAMAARGLMSVSRSSEKLTDLVLPAKMQRSLSQEFMRQQQQTNNAPQHYVPYQYVPSPAKPVAAEKSNEGESQQYPAQATAQSAHSNLNSSGLNDSVEVPSATKCSSCHETNVDTQLRPCGHMFHEKCLKSSLQTSMDTNPTCPICHVQIQSALLAIPTEEYSTSLPVSKAASWGNPTVKQVCDAKV